VAVGCRRLHNEELQSLYASPNIISVIKSRRMRWVGHVACMEGMRNAYKMFIGKPEGKRPLKELDIDGRITLEWIFWKQGGKVWTGCIRLRTGTIGRLL
jgi:hypothetical protein